MSIKSRYDLKRGVQVSVKKPHWKAKVTPEMQVEMKRLRWREGWGTQRIADHFKITVPTVCKWTAL